jgi:hypothetical protein
MPNFSRHDIILVRYPYLSFQCESRTASPRFRLQGVWGRQLSPNGGLGASPQGSETRE